MESGRTRGGSRGVTKLSPEKSASFHGKVPAGHRPLRRPKTQPNLISTSTDSESGLPPSDVSAPAASPDLPPSKRVPAKVLLNVTVRGSLAAIQVVASTDWTVGELIAGLLQQYAKEGRRPRLPSSEPADFGLHYSQFSLQGLDPREKLLELGSRNFFLCPKPATEPSAFTVTPAARAAELPSTGYLLAGLRLVDFLL